MLRTFDVPDELRKQIGGFFVVASHKPLDKMPHTTMEDGAEILLGPLLTIGEAETLAPAVLAFYVATQTATRPFAIGFARLEGADYAGRFNNLFGLDDEGKELPAKEYESTLEPLFGMLAVPKLNLDWIDDLPQEIKTAAAADLETIAANMPEQANALRSLLACADGRQLESAFMFTDLVLASDGNLPPMLLRDLFRARLLDRWARKAGTPNV